MGLQETDLKDIVDEECDQSIRAGVLTVMFFLCTVECYSIINPVFLHKFKSYNKENGKPVERQGRKARRD